MIKKILEAVAFLHDKKVIDPQVGVILGTGLSNRFPKLIENSITIDYADIPHFPVSTVETHRGRLVFGTVAKEKVVAMQGRFHYYEGYSMEQITFPVRVMAMLGVKYLLISNASGNLNKSWNRGELMLISDHINLQPDNPLRGKNIPELGPRFPDMSAPYSPALRTALKRIARQNGVVLNEGVYVAVPGPNLETRAEYRFLRMIGADAVGMSTVPEVIVANHMHLPCAAISVLTDDCDPDNLKPVSLEEIIAVAENAEPVVTGLFHQLIKTWQG
jgi:purine-nucleoside phosphorylase